MLQAHCGFDSVLGLGAAGGDRCWLVAPWWQTWEHLTRLISTLHSSMPVPPMRGHLPCRGTFAWIQKCPLKAGTTVVVFQISVIVDLPPMSNRNGDVWMEDALWIWIFSEAWSGYGKWWPRWNFCLVKSWRRLFLCITKVFLAVIFPLRMKAFAPKKSYPPVVCCLQSQCQSTRSALFGYHNTEATRTHWYRAIVL